MAEQLLVTGLTAASFQPDAATADPPARAQVVVIGAGILGSSIAYHLARLDREVLVIDRAAVGAGSSWHAAGLVARGRSTNMLTDLAAYGVELYARLQAETGIDVHHVRCGSLLLARTPGRMDELRELAAVARRNGVPYELVSPEGVQRLFPLASTEVLLGGLHQPDDGHINPGLGTVALAAGAHREGARFAEGVRVRGVRTERGQLVAVETDRGVVECETAVLATGLWTRDLAAACGASVPLYPAAHVHVRSRPVADADPLMPVVRDMDAFCYVRHLNGCLLVGAFEPKGKPLDPRSLPEGFAFGELAADWDHFAPVRALAEQRVPVLREVGFNRFLNAPESFTPDGNFCLGETAEVSGLYVAAGFNSQGIIFAPGAGRAVAEWIVAGAPTFDASAVDVQRFHPAQTGRRYLHQRTTEGLGRLYAMHWPDLQPKTARDLRRSPLHDRLAAAGACFGEVNGYEQPTWYAPAGVEPRDEYSFGRPNWFAYAGEEHQAARTAVALFDLSANATVDVSGADALALLQWLTTSDCDMASGRATHTLFLNERGGVELEATVVRRDSVRFLVLVPARGHTKALAILNRAVRDRWVLPRAARDPSVIVTDMSAAYAGLGLVGPRGPELLAEVEVGCESVLCLSREVAGDPQLELLVSSDQAVDLYDEMVAAGRGLGLRHAGSRALDSLRVENGVRRVGYDTSPAADPITAGLGHLVVLDKPGGFRGHDALVALAASPRPDRPVHVRLLDPAPLLRGGEAILRDGVGVGGVTSGAYGHTVGTACGLAMVRSSVRSGTGIVIDCAGELIPAEVSDTPFYALASE